MSLLPCETSRHASSFNADRNRLAPLTGLLLGANLEIFREGMHPNETEQFLPCCLSSVEVQECSENAARSPQCFGTNLLIYLGGKGKLFLGSIL